MTCKIIYIHTFFYKTFLQFLSLMGDSTSLDLFLLFFYITFPSSHSSLWRHEQLYTTVFTYAADLSTHFEALNFDTFPVF